MQEFNTNDKYFITKKLSDGDFQEKTLDELKADSDVYVPAFKKDSYNCKIPASEFGKGGGSTDFIIVQDDGPIYPAAGTAAPGNSKIEYIAFVHESVDKPNRKVRFSIFKDGHFSSYDNAGAMPGYKTSSLLSLGQTNRIIWNTWYSFVANSNYQTYKNNGFTYYDKESDTLGTLDNATIAAQVTVGSEINLYDGIEPATEKKINLHTLTVTKVENSLITGTVSPTLEAINEEPTTYHYNYAAVGTTEESNIDLVVITNNTSHIFEFINPARTFNISYESLVDGLVYEIRVNIRANGRVRDGEGIVSPSGYGGMLAPDITTRPFSIYFYNIENIAQDTYMWGGGDDKINCYIKPTFNRVPDDGSQVAFGPGERSNVTAPVLATAVVYFVKVDGKIYVMSY
jgi:hypothetical protein